MQRAQRVPVRGLAGEIALGGGGAVGAHGGEPGGVCGRPGIVAVQLAPAVDQLEERLDPAARAEAEKHPAALLAPFGEAGVDQDLHMTRDARLALAQDLGQFAHAQLHRAQQHEYPHPGRIRQCSEDTGRLRHDFRI
jgi:hypothetical protein